MKLPINTFKARLQTNDCQFGLWLGLPNPICAEISATAGFDWLLIDAEHAPYSLQDIQQQLQAIAPYKSHGIVRPADGSTSRIKQLLDLGCQTILVPMVESAAQAEDLVRAVNYPPIGIRGLGTSMARAAKWNGIANYANIANENICLIVQIETQKGLENLESILAIDGLDGVFIGPSDLSASMGYIGQPDHPEVRNAIENALAAIKQANKASGLLAITEDMANHYQKLGVDFIGLGVDAALLAKAVRGLASSYCQHEYKPTAAY